MFSVFEPQSWASLSLNWLICLIVILLIPMNFWISKSQYSYFLNDFVKLIYLNLKTNTTFYFSPGGVLVYISLLVFILMSNVSGLLCYVFTSTSHLVTTLSIALPFWAGHMVYAWVKTPNNMLAHLVPSGTPFVLMPFMVIIELISSIIRPITLSVRLAANMIAGHLLLTLISSSASLSVSLTFVMTGIVALAVLESAVAFIQAYVFTVLSVLYVDEVSSSNMSN